MYVLSTFCKFKKRNKMEKKKRKIVRFYAPCWSSMLFHFILLLIVHKVLCAYAVFDMGIVFCCCSCCTYFCVSDRDVGIWCRFLNDFYVT